MNTSEPQSTPQSPQPLKQQEANQPKPFKPRRLTHKQKIFVKEYIENKGNATKASAIAYKTNNDVTAGAIGYENLKKPQIIMALGKHSELVESTIINTINRYKDSDDIKEVTLANDNSKWVHDKIHGKAKQQLDVQSTSVNINISLVNDDNEDVTS